MPPTSISLCECGVRALFTLTFEGPPLSRSQPSSTNSSTSMGTLHRPLLGFPSHAAQSLYLRVPHPSRSLRRVGADDQTSPMFFSVLVFVFFVRRVPNFSPAVIHVAQLFCVWQKRGALWSQTCFADSGGTRRPRTRQAVLGSITRQLPRLGV